MYNDPELKIKNARLIFKNFEGRKTPYSAPGRRTFHVLLPVDLAKTLEEEGWNVKWPKNDPEGVLLPHTEIMVSFSNPRRIPKIYTVTSRKKQRLTEENVSMLDGAEIVNVDLNITPYNWEVNGKEGIKGYLKSMLVTLAEDDLENMYLDIPEYSSSAAMPDGDD